MEDPLVVVVDGEHQQDEARMTLLEPADALDARHARQSQVDQHDIGGPRAGP
jgi:hypothetical protein